MSGSYSSDLRVRVIEAISGGMSTRKAAERFGIGGSTAGAWMRRYRKTGEIAARKPAVDFLDRWGSPDDYVKVAPG